MGIAILSKPDYRIALVKPPYSDLIEIGLTWEPARLPPRGMMLVWWFIDATTQAHEFEWLLNRPRGLPLTIVLPPARSIARTLPLLNYVGSLNPRGVLPAGRLASPSLLRHLLRTPPRSIAEALTEYLTMRKMLRTDRIREEIRTVFELSTDITTVSALAQQLYVSRRTLGRHFAREGLPVPSHWLQFARLLRACLALQNESASVGKIALRLNYPDGFTMSNQMNRLLGIRPTNMREYLGWEWIVELWLRRELQQGAIDVHRYSNSLRHYVDDDSNGET